MASTRKPRTPKNAPQRPTITDEDYQVLLATRLETGHQFEAGTLDKDTKNLARAAVRKARLVRKAEEVSGVLPAWRAFQQAEAEAKEAAKAARPKRSRKAPAAKTEPTPQPEVTPQVEDEAGTEVQNENAEAAA